MIYCKGNIRYSVGEKESMHAFLIIGGRTEDRLAKISDLIAKSNIALSDIRPLLLSQDSLSLGIRTVRDWQKQLMLMPQTSPFSAGVIYSADLLTPEAQNALLKTLEEPPSHARIYMEAPSDAALLPTVLSRCQLIKLPAMQGDATEEQMRILQKLQQLTNPETSVGRAISILDAAIKNRDDATGWIASAIEILHKTRGDWPKQTYMQLMQRLLTAQKQLASNVTYKLVVDHVFLSIKH